MTLKTRAGTFIATILVVGAIVMGGLHYFAEHGQFAPASMTGGATRSDQRDATVSNDVANHHK